MLEINCVLTESTHTFNSCFAPFATVANWTRLEIARAANEVTEMYALQPTDLSTTTAIFSEQ